MREIAVGPEEILEARRRRTWRLAAMELPLLRVAGSALLSLAVYVNNRYLVSGSNEGWVVTTAVLAGYALLSWALLALMLRRKPPADLTLPVLFGDLPVWTVAIYCSGAEASWLYFILLLRVADQVQTTFRRALAFALAGTLCYAAMLGWVVVVDGRQIGLSAALAKLIFILFAGIYISLAARTAERRRAALTESVRVSRDLIRRLEEAHARAEEASAAKSAFVANMSHEMRTPLQGVIGMLQLAIDDAPSEDGVRRLESARRSAETLLAMIDDVLDFSRIEARKLDLEPVYFSLRQLMSDTMKSLAFIAASKGLVLSYFVHPALADSVWGDPVRLRQILVNLLGNAIKFTHQGEIAVHVSPAGTMVRFDVRDTGIGIDPALRERIFEPFTQADTSHSRSYGGAGLGLSIVSRLLEAMGGTVGVSSELGAGSVFTFDVLLPSDAAGAGAERQAWESELAGRSVIVIEESEMSRSIIAEVLRSRGVFASAFARWEDAPPQGRFSCAVTSDPDVPVQPQVLIASPLEQTGQALRVTRPVGERELLDALGTALGLCGQARPFGIESATRSRRAHRVLLVDDSEVNREVLGEMLRRLGHDVSLAADGQEALAALRRMELDVVFMDVQLPLIDGLEVTRRFRQEGGTTPVIALTAHTSLQDRDRCLAAGMNMVVTKPADARRLAAAIESVTREAAFADITGGNVALLARVRDAFARQTPELLDGIRSALGTGDAVTMARHAHKLKGSLSYFPVERASALASEIERAAELGDLRRVESLIPQLEGAVAELSDMLTRSAG